jgi:hypothetical protein
MMRNASVNRLIVALATSISWRQVWSQERERGQNPGINMTRCCSFIGDAGVAFRYYIQSGLVPWWRRESYMYISL